MNKYSCINYLIIIYMVFSAKISAMESSPENNSWCDIEFNGDKDSLKYLAGELLVSSSVEGAEQDIDFLYNHLITAGFRKRLQVFSWKIDEWLKNVKISDLKMVTSLESGMAKELDKLLTFCNENANNMPYLMSFEIVVNDAKCDGLSQLALSLGKNPYALKNIKELTIYEGGNSDNGMEKLLAFLKRNPKALSNLEVLSLPMNQLNDDELKNLIFFLSQNPARMPNLRLLNVMDNNDNGNWFKYLDGLQIRRKNLKKVQYGKNPASIPMPDFN